MAEFRRTRCQIKQRLSKATLLAMLTPDVSPRTLLESIPDDSWVIKSFDPEILEVCVELTTPQGLINILGITLPRLVTTPKF
jgi:hypothetical protein